MLLCSECFCGSIEPPPPPLAHARLLAAPPVPPVPPHPAEPASSFGRYQALCASIVEHAQTAAHLHNAGEQAAAEAEADAAAKAYYAAIALYPTELQAYFYGGQGFYNLLRFDEAVDAWKRVLPLIPEGNILRATVEKVNLPRALVAQASAVVEKSRTPTGQAELIDSSVSHVINGCTFHPIAEQQMPLFLHSLKNLIQYGDKSAQSRYGDGDSTIPDHGYTYLMRGPMAGTHLSDAPMTQPVASTCATDCTLTESCDFVVYAPVNCSDTAQGGIVEPGTSAIAGAMCLNDAHFADLPESIVLESYFHNHRNASDEKTPLGWLYAVERGVEPATACATNVQVMLKGPCHGPSPPPPAHPPPYSDVDVILGPRGNSCPAGYSKVTTFDECQSATATLRLGGSEAEEPTGTDAASLLQVGTETVPSMPSGCYYCHAACGRFKKPDHRVWLNYHLTGSANRDARPLCSRNVVPSPSSPLSPPPPLPLPPSASPWWVPFVVLFGCVFICACVAVGYLYHTRRSRREVNLRRSRDRAQLDLQLLAHQVEQTGLGLGHLMSPPTTPMGPLVRDPSPITRSDGTSSEIGRTLAQMQRKTGGGSRSGWSDETSSEIGRTFLEGGGEAAVTLSEVPEARLAASQTLLDVTRLAAGRVAPHHPLADCSISSSMGAAAMEANVHLLCMKGIEQRYNVPFDAAAVTIYAPIPQFRAGLAEQAGCTDGVLSEVERAKLLVIVGGDGRLVYAGTGDPIGPSSAHDAPCAHMFVALASGALYISADDRVEFHHELAGNAPVVAAGEMLLSDGRLHAINNRSGHYRPPPECLRVVVSLLRSEGAQTVVPFKEFHYDAAGDRRGGEELQTI
jgi:hypothetical protein